MSGAVKVDVFIAGSDPFDEERLEHRELLAMAPDSGPLVFMDTAEHSVLRKLEWYRRGGEVSERQWRDVTSILRAQGERLDGGRLERWASRLGVSDLLKTRPAGIGIPMNVWLERSPIRQYAMTGPFTSPPQRVDPVRALRAE